MNPRPAPAPRAAAARALLAVLGQGRSLDAALEASTQGLGEARDRALARALAYGVLRWRPRLEALADRLLERPLRARDLDVRVWVLLGLYQLLHSRIPPHAAVGETVELARAGGKPWAGGLVNAVLRRCQREGATLLAGIDRDPCVALAHPPWLCAAIREAWPDDWTAVLAAANEAPPMSLRVNRRRSTREAYLERLAAAGLAAEASPWAEDALILESPVEVDALPGFRAGEISVQDVGAQLAAGCLGAAPGHRVLDACAAPGGKSAHLLEREPALGALVAVDIDPQRCGRLRAGLERLGLEAEVHAADAADPRAWWDGRPFDRILLDAPCTATGVIRRHPDIKTLRRPEDVAPLAARQGRLLDALWPLLARGGCLLYATCSLLPAENDRVVEAFLARHEDAVPHPLHAGWGRPTDLGRQILTGEQRMDGFYYALLAGR